MWALVTMRVNERRGRDRPLVESLLRAPLARTVVRRQSSGSWGHPNLNEAQREALVEIVLLVVHSSSSRLTIAIGMRGEEQRARRRRLKGSAHHELDISAL
jgi:hypothetical protein